MTNLVLYLSTHYPDFMRLRYLELLQKGFPSVKTTLVTSPEEAAPHLGAADILMSFAPMLGQAPDMLKAATKLKWVQAFTTGVDGVVDNPALKKETILTSMKGVHGAPMSEAAISAMLALARHVPEIVRSQEKEAWYRNPPRLLYGKTAGIFGMGAIAEALAPRLKALGMKVIGISSSVRDVPGFDEVRARSGLPGIVGDMDYLILLTPLSPETRNIVNASVLAAMKKGSYLVNIARGGIVDEDALLAALKSGPMAGAALDVFAKEPLAAGSPFWKLPNVYITPHAGGTFTEYPDYTYPIVAENLKKFLAGDTASMLNLVAH